MSGGDDKKERMTMVKLQELLNDKMDDIIASNNQENKKLNEKMDNLIATKNFENKNLNENIDVIAKEVIKSEDSRNYMLSKENKRLSYERSSKDIGTEQQINFY